MKANEAPKKIWIDPATDLPKLSGHIDKESVEYIRTDVFIDKAAEWFDKNLVKYLVTRHVNGCKMSGIDVSLGKDFINYMKGE